MTASSKCRLIMVEGIPGSGKTSLATFIKQTLDQEGIPNRLYVEGDLDHPADFESVACFSRSDFDSFLSLHSSFRAILEQNVSIRGEDCFLAYRKLHLKDGQMVPDELIAELARHDVYETPSADTYRRLAADRWKTFVNQALVAEEIAIFECCFLQNPLTVLLGKHNVELRAATEHIQSIAAMLQPLRPALIYLWRADARQTLERVAQERPQAWKEFLISYFTGQGWGRAMGLRGFAGVIAFYEMRKSVERDLMRDLAMETLLIDNSDCDWAGSHRAVTAFLKRMIA